MKVKERLIRAIIKEPHEPAREELIENTLDAFQRLVGGYIETVTLGADWTVVCNEEGRLEGLPYNMELCGVDFVGTIVLVGVKGESFADFPASLERLKNIIPELFEEEEEDE